MTLETSSDPEPSPAGGDSPSRAHRIEDGLGLVLTMGLVGFPLLDLMLRRFDASIPGGLRIVQVLTLWVGLAGALIATREDQHLALTAGVSWLRGRARRVTQLISTLIAVAVTVTLGIGAYIVVEAETASTGEVAFGIPAWIPLVALPVGYLLMALRLAWVRSPREGPLPPWAWTILLSLVSAGLLFGLNGFDWEAREAWAPALILLTIASAVLGTPIYAILGGVALIAFWGQDDPIASVATATVRQLEDENLPVLPLFTFTGYILAESKASIRLVDAFRGLFGWLPGGMAVMTAVVCAFFTTFTGASGITILALGGLLYPVLTKDGYTDRFSVGLLTASGSIGLLFPPALPVIIFGVVAGVPIPELFVAGLIPGLVLVAAVASLGVFTASRSSTIKRQPFSWVAARDGVWAAKWELLVPVVAIGSYFSGLASLIEAAALTTAYAVFIEAVVHREVGWKQIFSVAKDSSALVGAVLVIFGVAMGLTDYLTDAEIPQRILEWVKSSIDKDNKFLFLAALNIFLLIVGCLMDIFSALVVVVPLILPVGAYFGVSPIHLGIIFLANLELGFLTPPVGMNLFLASYRFDRPLTFVYRTVLPFLGVLLLAVLLITYLPELTLGPVSWFFPPLDQAPPPIEL